MKHKGQCAKCGTRKEITRHHVLPRCMFGGRGGIVYLCRMCHDEIELLYQAAEKHSDGELRHGRRKLSSHKYVEILLKFVNQ